MTTLPRKPQSTQRLLATACLLAMQACMSQPLQAPGAGAGTNTSTRPLLPVPRSLTLNALGNLFDWNMTPPGINNTACKPAPGENPVILVHGTFANMMLAFSALGPTLHNAGICAYAYNYGAKNPDDWVHGLAPMQQSAQRLASEVDRVLAHTGAHKVDLIGHSQGGTLIHYYAKVMQGAAKVNTLIAVAPSLRGSPWIKPESNYVYCVACGQQSPQSDVLKALNNGPITQAGNRNFVLSTANDWVVYPVDQQFIREPGVSNVLLQDLHPGRWATHSGLLYDRDALQLMVSWLQAGKAHKEQAANHKPSAVSND